MKIIQEISDVFIAYSLLQIRVFKFSSSTISSKDWSTAKSDLRMLISFKELHTSASNRFFESGMATRIVEFRKLMVNSLLWDEQQNCLWIGAEGCLLQYSFKDSHVEASLALPSNTAKALAFDNKNNIVIGTDNGLYIYSRNLGKVNHILRDLQNEQSLCNNVISVSYTHLTLPTTSRV